ncbi:hypothetical protein Aeh1ORF266c [Aeromonas phage Aeh1]|uniref:Uncharacterized protein n=1 Tax=Aeromonas phage Aeh1 TaxID=2880362 RepID=Q76YG5_9CAUD|nr:hypothetical protein Aeh1p280 [Aeromonas phage Aeh1]AAQ17930.1 hypothetical protein Aeh1ORF266c [Aeromonas phage Aeh1]
MTPAQFETEIETKLIPVLASEYGKRGIQFGYSKTRPDEYSFQIRVPVPMQNGMVGFQSVNYTVWYVGDKIDWCVGDLPQFPPKDI